MAKSVDQVVDDLLAAREWEPMAPAEHSLADSLIASLRADGVTESEGEFSLAAEMAREKMQAFQLPDPAQYLLAFVQALVARGASRLEVEIDADDVRFTADGEPFSAPDLDQVFDALFLRSVAPRTKSIRQLAIGICTAEATAPKRVRVVSRDPIAEEARLLELRPGAPLRTGPARLEAGSTQIHVKYGLKHRIQRGLELRRRPDNLVELLRTRCRNARVEVVVNGERVSRGLHEFGFDGRSFDVDGCRGFVGRASHGDMSSLVKLIQHGVWFTTVQVDSLPESTFALVDSPRLSKDISQQHVVQDDAYEEVVQTLQDVSSGKVRA